MDNVMERRASAVTSFLHVVARSMRSHGNIKGQHDLSRTADSTRGAAKAANSSTFIARKPVSTSLVMGTLSDCLQAAHQQNEWTKTSSSHTSNMLVHETRHLQSQTDKRSWLVTAPWQISGDCRRRESTLALGGPRLRGAKLMTASSAIAGCKEGSHFPGWPLQF